MFRLACVFLALLLTSPLGSVAQEADYDLDALRNRIDSLSIAYQQLQHAAKMRDSIEAETRQNEKGSVILVGATVGPFNLITAERDRDRVEQLFAHAWQNAPALVRMAEDRLRGTTLVVAYRSDAAMLEAFANRHKHQFVSINTWRGDSFVEELIARAMLEATAQTFPQVVRRWLGNATLRTTDPRQLRRELAVAPGAKAQRCRAGDVHACIDVLGLRGENWNVWYSGHEIRERVRESSPELQKEFDLACGESDEMPACVSFVQTRFRLTPPVGSHMRGSFLRHVLDRAAATDLDRFASDSTATLEQLMRAVSGDLEAAVRSWHEELTGAAQPSMPATARAGVASLFWFVVAAGFATRSTRWRLG